MAKLAITFTILTSLFVLSHARSIASFNLPAIWKPSAKSSSISNSNINNDKTFSESVTSQENFQPIRLPSEKLSMPSVPLTKLAIPAGIQNTMTCARPIMVRCEVRLHPINRHFPVQPPHHQCNHHGKPTLNRRLVPQELQRKIPVFMGDFLRYGKGKQAGSVGVDRESSKDFNGNKPIEVQVKAYGSSTDQAGSSEELVYAGPLKEESTEARKAEERKEKESLYDSFRKFLFQA